MPPPAGLASGVSFCTTNKTSGVHPGSNGCINQVAVAADSVAMLAFSGGHGQPTAINSRTDQSRHVTASETGARGATPPTGGSNPSGPPSRGIQACTELRAQGALCAVTASPGFDTFTGAGTSGEGEGRGRRAEGCQVLGRYTTVYRYPHHAGTSLGHVPP